MPTLFVSGFRLNAKADSVALSFLGSSQSAEARMHPALDLISLASMPDGSPESKTVLLVDDHDLTRRTISILLRNSGFDVRTAVSGRAALRFLHFFRPDGVVLDLVLPDMSGIDVLHRLRGDAFLADTPVLIFSGDHDGLTGAPDIKSEARLLKGSVSWQTLIEMVTRLTEQKDTAFGAARKADRACQSVYPACEV